MEMFLVPLDRGGYVTYAPAFNVSIPLVCAIAEC